MTILEIIETIAIAASAIAAIATFIVRAVRENWVKQLKDTIVEAMHYAQEHFKDAKLKKDYVLDAIIEKCDTLGIPYKAIANKISKLIDTIKADYNIVKKGK